MADDINQIMANQHLKVNVTAAAFAAKYQSKVEVYRFLATEVHVYLPPPENVTTWHLRDLANGARKKILSKDIQHVAIPHFEGLGIREMIEYANLYPEVMKALPVGHKEIEKLPRQYLANIIHTLVGKPFQQWISTRVKARHEQMTKKKDMLIELDPDIEAIFKASTAVSGKFLHDLPNIFFLL